MFVLGPGLYYLMASIVFLYIMVLFLILVGIGHLMVLKRIALRTSYLEGTLDIILQSQERLNQLIVVYMNSAG